MRDSVVISLIIEIDLYTHNSRDRPVWKSGEPAALYGACANELVSGLSPQEIRGCIWLYVGGGGGIWQVLDSGGSGGLDSREFCAAMRKLVRTFLPQRSF